MDTPDIYNPHKGLAPVPDVQVYARPRGGIQWECPDCGYLHSKSPQFWKKAHVRCTNIKCHHKFRVGVGFTKSFMGYAHLMKKWYRNLANRIDPIGQHLTGRIYGVIDWHCPNCEYPQTSKADFKNVSVKCFDCGYVWYIQLLLYRPSGCKTIVPFDWSVNVWQADESLHSTEIDQV